jgi:PAB1-binding protein PBP1
VQGDGTATNQVATKASYNCTLTIAAPSPASYPVSATCVASSTINTTNSLTVRLMGLAQIPGNVIGAYATYNAKWNLHELAFGVTAN